MREREREKQCAPIDRTEKTEEEKQRQKKAFKQILVSVFEHDLNVF